MSYNLSEETLKQYKCSNCKLSGVKLWRRRLLIDNCKLFCVDCAIWNQYINGTVNKDHVFNLTKRVNIGDLVPAVPLIGYHIIKFNINILISNEGIEWWENLPDYVNR